MLSSKVFELDKQQHNLDKQQSILLQLKQYLINKAFKSQMKLKMNNNIIYQPNY